MSQIGTGELERRMRRRDIDVTGVRMGVTESLISPGVTPIGPQSPDANLLAQFNESLGLTGQFAGQVRQEIRAENFLDEKAKGANERIDRAKARLDSKIDLTKDLDNLKDIELDWYIELDEAGKSIEDYAETIYAIRLEGLSDAYKEAYIESHKPQMHATLLGYKETLKNREKDKLHKNFVDAMAGSLNGAGGNPLEEARAILGDMKTFFPEMDDRDIKAPLVNIGMEAARRGDEQTVQHVIDLLGVEHALDQDVMVRTLDQVSLTIQTKLMSDKADLVESMIREGVARESVERMIDKFDGDGEMFLRTKTQLRGMLNAREQSVVEDLQKKTIDNMKLVVGLGQYDDPTSVAAQIIDYMTRTDSDPNKIDVDAGLKLINDLESGMMHDARLQAVEHQFLQGAGQTTLPLTSTYDTAIDQSLASRNIVAAFRTENGEALIRQIIDPERFAFYSHKAGRVTSQARELIAAGLGGQVAQANEAAATYVELYKRDPKLAKQVQENMSPLARMRAGFIESRLAYNEAPWNEEGFAQLRLLELDRDTIRQTVWKPKSDLPVRDAEIRRTSRKYITEAVNDTDFQETYLFGVIRRRSIAPISAVQAEAYGDMLEQEFLYARSYIGDDARAMAKAKRNAAERFIVKHPPMLWDGDIHFVTDGPAPPIDMQQRVQMDLKKSGFSDDTIDTIISDYTPTWDPANKAWAFMRNGGDGKGELYQSPLKGGDFGETLLIDLLSNEEMLEIQDWGEKTRDKASRKESLPPTDIVFDGVDPATMMLIP